MKVPNICPVCSDEFRCEKTSIQELLIESKLCDRHDDHMIAYTMDSGDNKQVATISITIQDDLGATWFLNSKKLTIHGLNWNSSRKTSYLPFFEPDLTDYPTLVNKIKTYVLFS